MAFESAEEDNSVKSLKQAQSERNALAGKLEVYK